VGTSDVIAGLLWASVGISGGLGALVAGQLCTAGRERPIMALGMLATALAVWPTAAEFGLLGLVFGLMLAGVMAGPIDVGVLTLRQRRTNPNQLGRVLSISISLNIAGFPVGSAVAGALITWSMSATFAIAGLMSALAAIAIALIPAQEKTHLHHVQNF
jgi:predicted MFS family arabinose efflux permease